MNSVIKFLKSSGTYFLGNVLTKLVSFFLLPIYTRFIHPAQSGYFDLSFSYISIIVPIVFLEIWAAIMVFTLNRGDKDNPYKTILNGMLVFACSLAVYILAFGLFAIFNQADHLKLIFIYGIAIALQNCYSYLARTLGKNVTFALSGIVGSIVGSLCNIVMIVFFHMTITSLYYSAILALLVQVVILEASIKLHKNCSIDMLDLDIIKEMVRFSLPLALNTVCFWFLSSYNRVGISGILGLKANGIYSAAAKFTYALGLISNGFSMAWQELVYSLGNKKDDLSEFYSLASNYYIKFLMYGVLLFIPLIQLIFPFFVRNEYREAFPYIPIYLLASATSFYSIFLGDIFAAKKKTGIIFTSTLSAAIVNVTVFHLLVDSMGLQAANIALFLGFLTNIVIRLMLLKDIATIRINIKMLIFGFVLFFLTFAAYMTDTKWINITAFILLLFLSLFTFRDVVKQVVLSVKSRKNSS